MNKQFYLAMWRWHFFAGVYVVPFMLMLSLTGLLMLASPWADPWQYGEDLTRIEHQSENGIELQALTIQHQYQQVKQAYQGYQVVEYLPPADLTSSAMFKLNPVDEALLSQGTLLVFINPYSGEVLGDFFNKDRLYSIADDIHGTLMFESLGMNGKIGDALIELSAGLSILLLITGIYLHWPRTRPLSLFSLGFLNPLLWNAAIRKNIRSAWKDIHSSMGFYLSFLLLFFAITGMAWTGIWGQQLVQPFSTFPAEKRASHWQSSQPAANDQVDTYFSSNSYALLNSDELNEVPWNLELVQMPESEISDKTQPLTLDQVMAKALGLGLARPEANEQIASIYADDFRIHLPRGEKGVFTIMAVTSSGDISNPFGDRTVHLDQYSGKVLADIGWGDYSLGAKSMAAGIALHKGRVDWWNLILATAVCVLLIALSVSGFNLWWIRRNAVPAEQRALQAPPKQKLEQLHGNGKVLIVLMLIIGVLFPVTGVAILVFFLIEALISRASRKGEFMEQ